MNVKYIINLCASEREALLGLISKGKSSARMFKRSNILLMAYKAAHEDIDIGEFLSTGTATVFRTKRTFVEEGLEVVLDKDIRPGAARLLSALLVSMACSEPPEGRCRWTLQLLADFL